MAELWRPKRGLSVRALEGRRFLFRFYHKLDLRWVVDSGPWTHNGCLLLLHELRPPETPRTPALNKASFWLVAYNLTPGYFTEVVGRTLGNFVGRFVKYDPIQYYDGNKAVMRIRTELDITLPLKREKRIRRPGEQVITCCFKYEKLANYCFVCGMLGHVERTCDVRFDNPDGEVPKLWDIQLRAPPRLSLQPRVGAGYLIEEGMAGNNSAQQQWHNPSDVPKATSNMAAIIASEQRSYEVTGERKRRFQETTGSGSGDGADVMICSPTKKLSPAQPTSMQIPDPGQRMSTACKLLQFNP
ncbi:hypothetical protein LINGRAPRIM_LOCUS382 [Linum grandiflorum]